MPITTFVLLMASGCFVSGPDESPRSPNAPLPYIGFVRTAPLDSGWLKVALNCSCDFTFHVKPRIQGQFLSSENHVFYTSSVFEGVMRSSTAALRNFTFDEAKAFPPHVLLAENSAGAEFKILEVGRKGKQLTDSQIVMLLAAPTAHAAILEYEVQVDQPNVNVTWISGSILHWVPPQRFAPGSFPKERKVIVNQTAAFFIFPEREPKFHPTSSEPEYHVESAGQALQFRRVSIATYTATRENHSSSVLYPFAIVSPGNLTLKLLSEKTGPEISLPHFLALPWKPTLTRYALYPNPEFDGLLEE